MVENGRPNTTEAFDLFAAIQGVTGHKDGLDFRFKLGPGVERLIRIARKFHPLEHGVPLSFWQKRDQDFAGRRSMQWKMRARIDQELHGLGGRDLLQHDALHIGPDTHEHGFLRFIAQKLHDIERMFDQLVFTNGRIAERQELPAEAIAHVCTFTKKISALLQNSGDAKNAVRREQKFVREFAHTHSVWMVREKFEYAQCPIKRRNLVVFHSGIGFFRFHAGLYSYAKKSRCNHVEVSARTIFRLFY